jgi:hypothetical protein
MPVAIGSSGPSAVVAPPGLSTCRRIGVAGTAPVFTRQRTITPRVGAVTPFCTTVHSSAQLRGVVGSGVAVRSLPIVVAARAGAAAISIAATRPSTTLLLISRPYAILANVVLAVFDPDPLPFIALMGLGFLVGVAGHIYKSNAVIATGIGMIFAATILLPLGLYLSDN